MKIGIISGSGTDRWPGTASARRAITTRFGVADIAQGVVGATEVVHLSRHGTGHERLSSQVPHRAHLAALREAGVDAVVSLTICGSVDPQVDPGTIIVFDDLYFPENRLPDGSPCTWYDAPGDPQRGHWIFDTPFSERLRTALIASGERAALPVRPGGCYGHVAGPRFNSRTEIAALARAGVTAISQTAGPEVVLAGEMELPYALVGFVTDHANGVKPEPEPIDALLERMRASTHILAELVNGALPDMRDASPAGFVYRFEHPGEHG